MAFHRHIYDREWQFACGTKNYRVVMNKFHHVSTAFMELGRSYQEVIEDVTMRMGAGMAKFICKEIETIDDYDEYCYYVAELVGSGSSRLFHASGMEDLPPCTFFETTPGIMLLIFTKAPSHVPLKILSIEDGTVLKSFNHLLHRNKKVDFIEQFNEELLVKQDNENLQILDVRRLPTSTLESALPPAQALEDSSQLQPTIATNIVVLLCPPVFAAAFTSTGISFLELNVVKREVNFSELYVKIP
ncbi:Squalene synthase [Forsythia ovata]|uniref:Squalene synthase n=1 Tax=Forsythia ovata TaxID=205694 RepID=A0ABD1T5J4_9LAMI